MTPTAAPRHVGRYIDPENGVGTNLGVVLPSTSASDLWTNGAFGSSTRATRFKPSFLERPRPAKRRRPPRAREEERASKEDEEEEEDDLVRPQSIQLSLVEAEYLTRQAALEVAARTPPAPGAAYASFPSNASFETRYRAYDLFRRAGWTPKNGSQYGSDYVLYLKDPDSCHSRYCVTLRDEPLEVPARKRTKVVDVMRLVRVAEQTRKTLIMCDQDTKCVKFKRWVCKHEEADPRPA